MCLGNIVVMPLARNGAGETKKIIPKDDDKPTGSYFFLDETLKEPVVK